MNKQVIILTLQLGNDGAERVLSLLINQWLKKDVKVTIVQLSAHEYDSSYRFPDEVEIINFTRNYHTALGWRLWQLRSILYLLKLFHARKHATILSFINSTTMALGTCRPFIKNRIVLSERNNPRFSPPMRKHRKLRDRAFRNADFCVFQTPEARDYFPEAVRRKSVIIPNPMNPELPERYEGPREKTIVAAGRLTPQKNFPMLLKAFALLHEDFPEYRLFIYGRGELEGELKALANKLGVGAFVDFPGFSDNIYQDMLKCAVYVSSSDYEGISNSMLEALGMGIPSVVTDCPVGGARMTIQNGVNGVLVPVGDEKAMSEGIKKVLSDNAFAESIGREAYKLRDELSIDKIAEKWLEIL